MLAVVNVKIKHVSLVEIAVHERLLAPVVVSDLFPYVAGFAAHGQEPVMTLLPQRNEFDGVPRILPLGRIGKKTQVVFLAKQVIYRNRNWGVDFASRNRLSQSEDRTRK